MTKPTPLENFRLTVFRTVAEHRNFRIAAATLYLTQPAITQQIKALEAELGATLLDRSGRQIALTPAGEELLRHAIQSQEILQRAQSELAVLTGRVTGPLRLAVSTTIAQYVLPPMLGRFIRTYPGVTLQMRSANTGEVATAILDGQAEIGLVEGPVHRPELRLEPWLRDSLVLLVPAAHFWASLPSITLEDLAAAPLLQRERGSGTREIVDSALEAAGLPLEKMTPTMELNSTEALLACIEAGLGVGFHSRWAISRQARLGTLVAVPVRGLRIARDLSFLTLRANETRGNAALLLDFLRERVARARLRKQALPDR